MVTFCRKSVHTFLSLTTTPLHHHNNDYDHDEISNNNNTNNLIISPLTTTLNSQTTGGFGTLVTTEEDENITIRRGSTNDLESTAASSFKADPSSPYFSPSKTKDHHHGSSGRGMGFIDDFGAGVNGLTSCTESLGFESSDERRVEEDDHHVMDSVGGEELTLTSRPWSTSTATKAKCGGIRRRSIRDRHLYQNHEVKKFPPPLSSLNQNGQPSFYLQAVRKEGRLELTEVRIHRPEILRAFRENGRLRLQFIREDDDCDDAEEEEDCNDEKVEEKEKEVVPEEVIISEEKKEEEEEKDDGDDDDDQEIKIPVSSGEGLRRCHEEVVNNHNHHHHHHGHQHQGHGHSRSHHQYHQHQHHLHVWRQTHCVTTR
ncbi:hypothetical protein G4B88_003439 [Cannabis sativa]|uniref:FAF domain-containing protein n=1 Tax=Cannabis sativa TaxID=3483 RepID=A0A7J6H3V9_CANSA|nr:hypothetical protein G4B88_003439 [Cannabis sativa]